jgi:hypothetical protein
MIAVATMALLLIGSADARCRQGFKSCRFNHPNRCETRVDTDVNNCGDCKNKCPTYPYTIPTCFRGKCGARCVRGWKDCNNRKHDGCEVNVRRDDKNCGSCGNRCIGRGAKCVNGKCERGCRPGWMDCHHDGMCMDTSTDINNCGRCRNKCVQPKYFGGETVCKRGRCMEQCKTGMRFDKDKKRCV